MTSTEVQIVTQDVTEIFHYNVLMLGIMGLVVLSATFGLLLSLALWTHFKGKK